MILNYFGFPFKCFSFKCIPGSSCLSLLFFPFDVSIDLHIVSVQYCCFSLSRASVFVVCFCLFVLILISLYEVLESGVLCHWNHCAEIRFSGTQEGFQ